MERINLNFFGEKVTIDIPKDLNSLRNKISNIYLISDSDADEIILFYVKDSKKNYIINGNDFDKFKESKIDTIFLDVNQNSKLYLDNVFQIKNEIKNEKETKDKKEENVDKEKDKKEIEKLMVEKEEIVKRQKEKSKLCEDKLDDIKKQKLELENIEREISLECTLDILELKEKSDEIDKKIEEIRNKGKLKKELVLGSSGQCKYPYSQENFKFLNFKKPKALFNALNSLKEKRMRERKALEEKKLLESKNEEILKNMKADLPNAVPIFKKVNDVLNQTIQKVKQLAKEKIIMTKEEKEIAKKEEDMKKEKEKLKKEQIVKIQKITRDAVNEINNLTKLVIEQSNLLIEKINNPQLYKSQSSDDIILRTAPKIEKKEKLEIHYNVICDGCKETPLRGYKCKKCKNFDFCEDCYKKNKEIHGHDFKIIEHPHCRNRLGHPNKKYCLRGIVHSKIMCDGCGMLPLVGWRYKCSICDDYNLCENCEERIGGKHNHPFIKITYSLMLDKFNENYLKLNTYEPNK